MDIGHLEPHEVEALIALDTAIINPGKAEEEEEEKDPLAETKKRAWPKRKL